MNREKRKQARRTRRHLHVRHHVHGTAERPRLAVYRSLQHIYAQIINDDEGRTLVAMGTTSKDLALAKTGNVAAAEAVGTKLAELAKTAGISQVAFDRGFCKFHGRVKALAEAARKGGLKF